MARENSVIQLYGTTASDNSASIDIPDDGLLLSTFMFIEGVLNADTEEVNASVEFGATNSKGTNDSRTLIAYVSAKVGLLTSGAASNVGQSFISYGDGLRVFGGERLFLHTLASSGATLNEARALLVFNFASFVARRR